MCFSSSESSTDCSRIAVVSARPMPRADSTPAIGGTRTVRIPRESATAHACWAPAPPKVVSTYCVMSWPFWTETRLIALPMFATAICRKPSATCSGERGHLSCMDVLGQVGEASRDGFAVE